jgi:hypothetical protein
MFGVALDISLWLSAAAAAMLGAIAGKCLVLLSEVVFLYQNKVEEASREDFQLRAVFLQQVNWQGISGSFPIVSRGRRDAATDKQTETTPHKMACSNTASQFKNEHSSLLFAKSMQLIDIKSNAKRMIN